MVTVSKYVEKVEEIYNENPDYESGGDGSNGKCDCIGMCRGALERAGATGVHNMRGTNNAVRNLDLNLQPLTNSKQLSVGDIVMKTRDKDDKNMPLPDQYRVGGSQYDPKWGETNFTHIGTVTSTNPLVITHMTEPHPKKAKSISGWTWYGQLPWVEHGDQPQPEPPEPVEETAVVVADHGNTVKMRAKPSTKCNLYWDVPVGSVVTVKEHKDDWCKIVYDKITGYMMTQFLDFNPSPSPSTTLYTVHIPYLTKEQAQELLKQYPGSWMTEETQSVG